MPAKRPGLTASHLVPVAQPEPLNLTDLRYVRDILAEFAPDWCAELDGICTDEATIVVVPELGGDEAGPSFVVSREGFGYRVDQVHWDEMRDVGLFSTLDDAVAAVQRVLLLDAARRHEGSSSLH